MATVKRQEVACAVGIVASLVLLSYVTIVGKSAIRVDSTALAAVGLGCAAVSGIVSAANNVVSKRLAARGFTSSELMALRFYFLIASSIACIFLNKVPLALPSNQYLTIFAISFLGIIVPLYVLQVGITKIDVNSTALIITVGPIITFLTQIANGSFNVSWYSLIGISLALVFVVTGIRFKIREAIAAGIASKTS